ncbi:substrate-specific activator of APC-dependent proteolysis [Ascosphaera aggregata]|nr:substrate-specific activator of APC-dependent proteolysis [Ascosphaera aggregata]
MARTANAIGGATAVATTMTTAAAGAVRTGNRSASRTRSGSVRVTRNATKQGHAPTTADQSDETTPESTRATNAKPRTVTRISKVEMPAQTHHQHIAAVGGYSYPHTRSHTHSHSHINISSHDQESIDANSSPRTATPTSTTEEITAAASRTSSRGYTPPLTRLREKTFLTHDSTGPTLTTKSANDGLAPPRNSDRVRATRRRLRAADSTQSETPSHLQDQFQMESQIHTHEMQSIARPISTNGERSSAHGHRPLTRGHLYYSSTSLSSSSSSSSSAAATTSAPPSTTETLNSLHTTSSQAAIPEAEMETDHDSAPTNGHMLRSMNAGRDLRYHTRRSRTPEVVSTNGNASIGVGVLRGFERELMATAGTTSATTAAGTSARARTPENGRSGSGTSGTGSMRKRQRVYGDRFIPNRDGQDLQASYSLLGEDGGPTTPSKSRRRPPRGELHFQKVEEANRTYSRVLRNEVFGDSVPQVEIESASPDLPSTNSAMRTPPSYKAASALPPASITPSTPSKNLFSYAANRASGSLTPSRTPRSTRTDGVGDGVGINGAVGGGGGGNPASNFNMQSDLYSLSPIRLGSQRLLQSAKKQPRYINRVPYKVLDAPELADDFYLNLVDWGSSNIVGVGLGDSVYMWDASSGEVTNLCKLNDDIVTSVSWIQRGTHLAIGTNKGFVQIWDAQQQRRLRTMTGHTMRVGALAWNDHILTSGSRDRIIYHRDVRSADQHVRTLTGHTQEVCGLKWNTEDGQLASGGNDNNLMIWDKLSETPLYRFSDHTAAVKAIAWSPHRRRLLASGGGTADRTIKFWNTATGQLIKDVDTGSQVCNLAWSQNSDEIVSTHGYSQHQVVVWKYPRMEQIVSLTGHTYRVLYLAMSPDGQSVVTGAGDETLRFWKVFNKKSGVEGRETRSASSAVIR